MSISVIVLLFGVLSLGAFNAEPLTRTDSKPATVAKASLTRGILSNHHHHHPHNAESDGRRNMTIDTKRIIFNEENPMPPYIVNIPKDFLYSLPTISGNVINVLNIPERMRIFETDFYTAIYDTPRSWTDGHYKYLDGSADGNIHISISMLVFIHTCSYYYANIHEYS